MEKIAADEVVYHKSCFRCCHCNRVLRWALLMTMCYLSASGTSATHLTVSRLRTHYTVC